MGIDNLVMVLWENGNWIAAKMIIIGEYKMSKSYIEIWYIEYFSLRKETKIWVLIYNFSIELKASRYTKVFDKAFWYK